MSAGGGHREPHPELLCHIRRDGRGISRRTLCARFIFRGRIGRDARIMRIGTFYGRRFTEQPHFTKARIAKEIKDEEMCARRVY